MDQHLLDKIDELKLKRGTNRSEAMRHIVSEYFKAGSMDVVDELDKLKRQNLELRVQIDSLMKMFIEQREEILTMLILLGQKDPIFREQVRARFPEFWQKPKT
jgi:hypothetical protein